VGDLCEQEEASKVWLRARGFVRARASAGCQALDDANPEVLKSRNAKRKTTAKLLEVEAAREDSRAVENCYKLKLKKLFDQRLADIEQVHKVM
jgi:hypothetical protein